MTWLIAFAILTSGGQVIRKTAAVEFPTEQSCEATGKATFADFRKQDWWAFFECQQQPQK